jgi:hypothetical protein
MFLCRVEFATGNGHMYAELWSSGHTVGDECMS